VRGRAPRTGGAGVVLLSATPAKNSPLEFYNLIQYVDHDAWSRMGIRDPEQFIDRYLRIELKPVVDTKMDVVERRPVVGFQNLHELREVIFRYGEFKTAEEVGLLKLPEPKVNVVEVDMDAAQDAKYDRYVAQIEAPARSTTSTCPGPPRTSSSAMAGPCARATPSAP
jgi:N12 class adenine-specific DNA methylase